MPSPVDVICMKWGTLYGPHYVNRLYGMTIRHLSLPFRFVCFTDDTSSLRQETREVSDGLNVDLDTGSEVIGFDIDHASSRFDQSTLETEAPPLLRSTKVG